MRARILVVGTVLGLVLLVAGPSAAKMMITSAHIRGPGLDPGGLRISGPDTTGMWESGIDMSGGLDDARADSIAELGVTPAELGPKYVVTFRFDVGPRGADIVRQDLYPYAAGGALTYTRAGQGVAEDEPWGGPVSAGWFRAPSSFFEYLTDQGLPDTSPITPVARTQPRAESPNVPQTSSWGWMVLMLAGVAGVAFAAWRPRRQALGSRVL